MAAIESLGIRRLEAIHYYVHDLARSRAFYRERFCLPEIAISSPRVEAAGRQRSAVFSTGQVHIVVSEPRGAGGRADRFLRNHPDGIGTLVFEVEDVARTFALLDKRGGTPIDEVRRERDEGGEVAFFSITTPLGETTFRFVERSGYRGVFPGFVDVEPQAENPFALGAVDHVTSNFQTMSPALLWFEHVLGFERYWSIEFHTSDVVRGGGSGLRSVVMRDPVSGIKFANNEPLRPSFKTSQVNLFHREHRGDGVQHVALLTDDLCAAVRGLRQRGVEFMPAPPSYYARLEARLAAQGVGTLDEATDVLRELDILVDGSARSKYMLQVFLADSQTLHKDSAAGPFFFELMQRKGDLGFGEGNFRALFESIEESEQNKGAA